MSDFIKFWFIACVVTASLFCPRESYAEFAIGGTAEFKKSTKIASATLHRAFSKFHLFMAAIDNENLEAAEIEKMEFIILLRQSISEYEAAISEAGQRKVIAAPTNDNEARQISFFFNRAASFGISFPLSEKKIGMGVQMAVSEFRSRFIELSSSNLLDDIETQQKLVRYANDLQAFLLTATTVLRLG